MLYKANLIIDLPGDSPDDAISRLNTRLPGWMVKVITIDLADAQPSKITGTININLPSPKTAAR